MEQIEKDAILNLVPGPIAKGLADQDWDSLLELVFDLGYHPQCRYPDRIDYLDKLSKVDAATASEEIGARDRP